MTNREAKECILKWCEDKASIPFSWPTDGCNYDQHVRFVLYKHEHWKGGSPKDFIEFVKAYANSLSLWEYGKLNTLSLS